MNADTFWEIIAAAKARTGPGRPFGQALADHLATFNEQGILEYQERFDQAHEALYRWDVWAAAYLIGGGCSDDSFIDFRAGIIAQGRDWYEKTAASPDNLADHPAVTAAARRYATSALFDERANYAAMEAYERVTGNTDGFNDAWARYQCPPQPRGQDPAGEDFDFDDPQQMRRRLPRLSAIFLADSPLCGRCGAAGFRPATAAQRPGTGRVVALAAGAAAMPGRAR